VHEYLPYCAHGCVIVTPRNKEAALQLVEQRDIITLNRMNVLQARTLFTKKLGVQAASGNAAELTELATILEHISLALVRRPQLQKSRDSTVCGRLYRLMLLAARFWWGGTLTDVVH
jgi:hypothetical protein